MKIKRFILTNENIDMCIAMIRQKGEDCKSDKKMLLKTCLSMEEVLLNYQAHFGTEQEIVLKYKTRFSDFLITLELLGKQYDPIGAAEQESFNTILNALDLEPRYSYFTGVNRISFTVKVNPGRKDFITILTAVALGVIIGCLGRYLPEGIFQPCLLIVQKISDAIFGLIPMLVVVVLINNIWSGTIGAEVLKLWKIIAVYLITTFLILTVYVSIIACKFRMPLKK